MPGLDPGIFLVPMEKDARIKCGHDEKDGSATATPSMKSYSVRPGGNGKFICCRVRLSVATSRTHS